MANKILTTHIEVKTIAINRNGKDIQTIINKYHKLLDGALAGITQAIRDDEELKNIINEVAVGERLKHLEVINY